MELKALYIAARARQISSRKHQTLAHDVSYHTSMIHRRSKQLNQGEALELRLEAGEAQSRSCTAVEDQRLQAAATSPPWIIFFTKSE
jgi:DNA-directed RNA polymerase subunit K/omega